MTTKILRRRDELRELFDEAVKELLAGSWRDFSRNAPDGFLMSGGLVLPGLPSDISRQNTVLPFPSLPYGPASTRSSSESVDANGRSPTERRLIWENWRLKFVYSCRTRIKEVLSRSELFIYNETYKYVYPQTEDHPNIRLNSDLAPEIIYKQWRYSLDDKTLAEMTSFHFDSRTAFRFVKQYVDPILDKYGVKLQIVKAPKEKPEQKRYDTLFDYFLKPERFDECVAALKKLAQENKRQILTPDGHWIKQSGNKAILVAWIDYLISLQIISSDYSSTSRQLRVPILEKQFPGLKWGKDGRTISERSDKQFLFLGSLRLILPK